MNIGMRSATTESRAKAVLQVPSVVQGTPRAWLQFLTVAGEIILADRPTTSRQGHGIGAESLP
jgi:hypothetical protein